MSGFLLHRDIKTGGAGSIRRIVAAVLAILLPLIFLACNKVDKPESGSYYGGTAPPRKQEFRWSNGKMPKTLDPARAATPPETDIIRALFEGLTELDPATLEAKPAVAERWTSSEDFKTWTFQLRSNARWSNGSPVTAADFVRSWRRLDKLGDATAHRDLLANIVGFAAARNVTDAPSTGSSSSSNASADGESPAGPAETGSPAAPNSNLKNESGPAPDPSGVAALDPRTLQVILTVPDRDFPKLVANAIFRPAFDSANTSSYPVTGDAVTNGAFRITSIDEHGITLNRSETYWNREAIMLETVRFVAAENSEQALAAYRAGEVDAITNADFEPLALKLFEPFEDFRRRTHAAVNFYEINHEKFPFDDRRVREALAISIERERLTEGDMEGTTRPAFSFLPFGSRADTKIVQDKERARELLEEAGFPGGESFPVIKLVINRNDVQQRLARSVARMWKQHLNLETEIIVKENAELEAARKAGDFDLVRRGAVFPTADELMSVLLILKPAAGTASTQPAKPVDNQVEVRESESAGELRSEQNAGSTVESPDVTMSEANAIYELWAIPLYFPTSYSLVKPYVSGFEMNSLDVASLNDVSIDSDWQPK